MLKLWESRLISRYNNIVWSWKREYNILEERDKIWNKSKGVNNLFINEDKKKRLFIVKKNIYLSFMDGIYMINF